MKSFRTEQVVDSDVQTLDALVAESVTEGFHFLRRLVEEWKAGVNRFDRRGEALFVSLIDGSVQGVCGLNRDPYARIGSIGRLRHLYVASAHRRQGIGRLLVGTVVAAACKSFASLTLRTDSPAAATFYRALGFTPATEMTNTTHILEFRTPVAVLVNDVTR